MKKHRRPSPRPSNTRPAGDRDRGPRGVIASLPPPDLYGTHAVRAAILNPERVIQTIWCTDDRGDDVNAMLDEAAARGIKRPTPFLVPRAALDRATGNDAVHQGVAAQAEPLPEVSVEDLMIAVAAQKSGVLVMLDQVTDPHNFGAILRSACAFGAIGVIVQRRHAPDLTPLVAKTACGAVEHIGVAYEVNLSRAIERLKEEGFTVAGLDERGEVALPGWIPPKKTVLVLGAEGPGLRRLVREGCDVLVRLPMTGAMPSINVSNAAAVALYHACAGAGKN